MSTKRTKLNISTTNNAARPKRVFVGLSGGVDSAVSAALLKEQGFEVTGVFIKVWQPDFLPCTWREERRDAMRVAAALDIPFLFFDFEEEYRLGVADYMIEEYKAGRTPNPDVMCNKEIKFGAFLKRAKGMGADFIATGHYAQRIYNEKKDRYELYEGKDKDKDQSYFLWTITEGILRDSLFPVGGMEKSDVRELAEKFNLPVSEKKDSQGICFIGDVSMEDFLKEFIKSEPGNVLNTKGKAIGRHKGAIYFTIGERRGFDVTIKGPKDRPYYVVSKDMKKNTITVSNDTEEINSLSPRSISVTHTNWISDPLKGSKLKARIRYRGEKLPIKMEIRDDSMQVYFNDPVIGLSLGQSIVFYKDDECLGGGIMDQVQANK